MSQKKYIFFGTPSLLLIFLKVDYEQALPKNKENFKWEIHVLFDDAINCNFQTSEIVPNEFLRTFCDEMESMIATYDIEHKAEVVQRSFYVRKDLLHYL